MQSTLIVFLGGGLGAALRHGVNTAFARWLGSGFPWHTLTINMVGSLVMGLLTGWLAFKAEAPWSQSARLFLTTGICGGFTTFSAFSLDAVLLWERGETAATAGYIVGSVVLCILGLVAGLAVMRSMS
ncbi:fluoride efflux transporter CrcB [uncultured Alsobacter sp.]|uniref:fluoride efflux transporter CrcB n=1 Tax=uncultured Alsobacter sp. TaxID=1748258 RepID=UPI0025CFBF7A|nr:fluoride efflux transporter CrcB [uncultured Alsobacter sp.]